MTATGAAEWASSGTEVAPVAVLFAPETVPVLDIFRVLGDFEDHYDFIALDALESRLSATMSRDLAKGLVSDALLLAFGLRRERAEALEFRAVLSRRGTLDEYRLMGVIGATFWHDFELAREAAAALGIRHPDPLVSLAFDIARRIETAGGRLDAPDSRLLRVKPPASLLEVLVRRESCPDVKSSFDF
jgi:hypothetical protein